MAAQELPLKFPRRGTTEADRQANYFAAVLLMPTAEFREKFAEFRGNVYLLAGYFKVPTAEVTRRAVYLELMTEETKGD